MASERVICPLLSLGAHLCGERTEAGVFCQGRRCAWWDARTYCEPGVGHTEGRCALLTIAQQGNGQQ